MTARRAKCTHHCATCGAHFHSLHGFDAHHPGECITEDTITENVHLEAWTEDGWCELADGHNAKKPQHPVTIYTRAGLSQRREALAAQRERE